MQGDDISVRAVSWALNLCCKNVPIAQIEISPAQSPVTTGNARACFRKRGRGEYGGTFPLLYPPGTQHNPLRENLISEHVTDESDVSSAHTHVLYN